MKKILIINTGGLAVGGITTHIMTYMSALLSENSNKYEVTLVATIFQDPDVINSFEEIGCHVVKVANRKTDLTRYIKDIWHLMRKNNYDVVHVHGSSSILCVELLLAKFAGVKIRIAHSHNTMTEHKLANNLLYPLFRLSYNKALACSKAAGKWLYRNDNFIVLHNVFDYEHYAFNDATRKKYRSMLGIDEDTLTLGSVGYVGGVKNQIYILKMLPDLLAKRKLKYIIVGDGDYRTEYEEWVAQNGLTDEVLFLGLRNDVDQILQAFDMFVMPSFHEGLPIALLEAEASGLHCLVSADVTTEAQLYDSAEFLALETSEVWEEKIVKCPIDNNLRCKNSAIAMDKLRRDYNLSIELKKLEKLYDGKN